MKNALISGAVGAVALTILHETIRNFVAQAPRVDIAGERAIALTIEIAGFDPPPARDLYSAALIGDLVSNSLYYSLVGAGSRENVLLRGALLGAAAGVGAAFLPEKIGLGKKPTARTPQTAAMTIGWYLFGGVSAALCYRLLSD